MKLKGKVHIFGDDVDTDAIIPGAYLKTTDVYELASHCMAGIDEDFPKRVNEGDLIVAGENFGCGSSREQAPISIKYCGIKAIVAESFARIFYRNCINIGLIPIVCKGIKKHVEDGYTIEIDLGNEEIKIEDTEGTITKKIKCSTPKGLARDILSAGGLVNYAKQKELK